MPSKVPVSTLQIQEGILMKNSQEINRLCHLVFEHTESIQKILSAVRSLTDEKSYLSEDIYVAEQNCAMLKNKVIVACAITESVENNPPVAQ